MCALPFPDFLRLPSADVVSVTIYPRNDIQPYKRVNPGKSSAQIARKRTSYRQEGRLRPIPIAPAQRLVYVEPPMSDDPVSSTTLDPDADLMLQVAAGSRTAFTELVHRHQNSLLNFFHRMGAYSDAEDLVQETFVRLFRARARYRPTARFTTFLYVLARHAWADHGRRSWRRDRLETGLEAETAIADRERGTSVANRFDMQAALDRLSPKLKEVLVLNVYQGLRYQEIADVLAIPLGTVKSRINLALQELRKQFHED